MDAVANGTVECGQTYGGYYIGKTPALIFDGSLPFGFSSGAPEAAELPAEAPEAAAGTTEARR